ncbi:uncharacterized protein LOC144579581 isoform X1 [Callithrix jacchus]
MGSQDHLIFPPPHRHIRWPSGHQRQRSRHRSDVAGRLCGSQPGGAQPGLASEQVDGDCRATEKPEPTCPGQSPSRRPSSRTPHPAWGTASGWGRVSARETTCLLCERLNSEDEKISYRSGNMFTNHLSDQEIISRDSSV